MSWDFVVQLLGAGLVAMAVAISFGIGFLLIIETVFSIVNRYDNVDDVSDTLKTVIQGAKLIAGRIWRDMKGDN